MCVTAPARPVSIDGSSSSSTVAVAASSSLTGFVESITDSTERVVFVPHSELAISMPWIVSCQVVCLLPRRLSSTSSSSTIIFFSFLFLVFPSSYFKFRVQCIQTTSTSTLTYHDRFLSSLNNTMYFHP